MIKAVIFDYGGVIKTLKHNKDRDADALYEARDAAVLYGISKKMIIKKWRPLVKLLQKGVITENYFWRDLSSSLKKPIPKNKKQLWRKSYRKTFYIIPEIISFIRKLRTDGIKTAVLSNTIKPHVEIITKYNGYKYFDAVVLSCRVNLMKPDQKIYLLTTKQLRVKPKECIFIDDREENLKPARKLGMKTVLAKSPRQVIKSVSQLLIT